MLCYNNRQWGAIKWSLSIHGQTNLQFWKIYLDTCCLSRLFDPPTQERIVQEAEAIRHVFTYFFRGDWHWISSEVLLDEVDRTADVEEQTQIKAWLTLAQRTVFATSSESTRGNQLEKLGFKHNDALHLACAEGGEADIFLTTDDRLLQRTKNYQTQLRVQAENPYMWVRQETSNEYFRDD